MNKILAQLHQYAALSTDAQEAIGQALQKNHYAKNDFLLRKGQVCRHIYFIEKGALRGFYHTEEKEISHWFAFENDFVTSFHSFITGERAVENIQFLEGAVLWAIPKDTLHELFDRFHEIERLVRIAYEKYYLRLEERFVNAQFKTAAERYEELLLTHPHIINRVPLGQVASYLGISQETLSRVRAGAMK